MFARRLLGLAPRRPHHVALYVLLGACTANQGTPANSSAGDKPEVARASAPTPAEDLSAETPAPIDKAAAARHRKAARSHSKAAQWREAIAEFERATAADPTDGRLLCELGWAQFRGTEEDGAAASLLRGVGLIEAAMADDEALRKPLGACLYNLGRVAEAKGAKDEAAKHYRRSLALRPGNSVVEGRLSSVESGTVAAAAESHGPIACADGPGLQVDLAAWSESLRAHTGAPESFNPMLAKIGLGPVSDEPFIDYFGDEEAPVSVGAEVTLSSLRLGERTASLVHLALHDGGDGRAERVAVLLPSPSGTLCLAGELGHEQMMCAGNCLHDGPPLSLDKVQLIAADVDALRVDISSGACCGSDRGGEIRSSFYGVEGAALTRYAEITTMSAWYTSPHPPVEETSATIELQGGFPKQISVETRVTCTLDCTDEERRALVARREATGDEEAAAAIALELEETCGPEAEACKESTSRERYAYSGGTYRSTR